MSMKDDGGAAFPVMPPRAEFGDGHASGFPWPENGMTLRDYFAAKAMPIVFDGYMKTNLSGTKQEMGKQMAEDILNRAWFCYAMADAMLKERTK